MHRCLAFLSTLHKWITQYVVFWVWLVLLNIMIVRCIHFVSCSCNLLVFVMMFAFHCVTNPPFIYPFLCRWALGQVSFAVVVPMHASWCIHVTPAVGVHLGIELKVY